MYVYINNVYICIDDVNEKTILTCYVQVTWTIESITSDDTIDEHENNRIEDMHHFNNRC
jgi:hypothetical protein